MAFTAIPSGDVWVQIGSTQTPTSGAAVTFTSIPSVKKLRFIVSGVSLTVAGRIDVTLNNDTGSNYNVAYQTYNGTVTTPSVFNNTAFQMTRTGGAASHVQDGIIDYCNQAAPKSLQAFGGNNGSNPVAFPISANWNSTAIVNRIDFTAVGTTFAAGNTGTIAIYGAF